MNTIFNTSDGSVWFRMSARELANVPVWKGNRVIDMAHVLQIEESISSIQALDTSPFRIAQVFDDEHKFQRFIIDGQHRAMVLRNYFSANPAAQDFSVIVAMCTFAREEEIIRCFRILNNTKAIQWKEDPVMVANVYIQALMQEFNRDRRRPVLRSGRTVKPFLSIDKLRECIVAKHLPEWIKTPEEFVEIARKRNSEMLVALRSRTQIDDSQARAILYNFGLGLDATFSWIS